MEKKHKAFLYAIIISLFLIFLDNTLGAEIIIFKGAIILTVFLYSFIQYLSALRINVFNKSLFCIAIAYAYFNPVNYLEILNHHYGERVIVHVYDYMIKHGFIYWNYLIVSIPLVFLFFDKAITKDINGKSKFISITFLSLIVYTASFIAFVSSKRQIGAALTILLLPGIIRTVHRFITNNFGMKIIKVQHKFIRKAGFSIEGFIGSTIVLLIILFIIEFVAREWFILRDWTEFLSANGATTESPVFSFILVILLAVVILIAFPLAYFIRLWMNKMIYLEHSTSSRKYPDIFIMTLTPMLIYAGISLLTILVALV